jgi:hypothetical protein
MDERIVRLLKMHEEAMDRLPVVKAKIPNACEAIQYSIAKYYPALEKLASE